MVRVGTELVRVGTDTQTRLKGRTGTLVRVGTGTGRDGYTGKGMDRYIYKAYG